MSSTFRHLSRTYHELPLFQIKEQRQKRRGLNSEWLVARGYLVGSFYSPVELKNDDEVVFVGDFTGFFEQYEEDQASLYFEGRIVSLEVLSVNGNPNFDNKNEMDENIFSGYFKGSITKLIDSTLLLDQNYSIGSLLAQSFLRQQFEEQLLIPAYTRFILKNVNSINLQQGNAQVSGDLVIDIKITEEMMAHFQNYPDLFVTLSLNRENSIQLPLKRSGTYKDNQNDISYKYHSDKEQLCFVIRKIFEAEIQSSYRQFFIPFNLLYLKIVVTYLPCQVPLPSKSQSEAGDTSNYSVSNVSEPALRKSKASSAKISKKSKRKIKDQQSVQKRVMIKFVCLDLDDYLEHNNPYSSFNELWDSGRQKVVNRMTKINFITSSECGDFRLSSNYLALFPYHKASLFNSTRKNSSFYWNLGLQSRNKDIVDPEVYSIRQEYQARSLKAGRQEKKLFELAEWRHVHIEIPIYKYWVIYIIQLCVPILILSVISMFIFLQGNGETQQAGNVFNLRVANATALLLAYGALIPVFKQTTSKATYFSFFYIIIYLAIVPLILALIASVINSNVQFNDWQKTYKPFQDPYFVASLIFLGSLLFIVFVIVIMATFISKEYQIDGRIYKFNFKKMSEAHEPFGFSDYISKINLLRGNQYRYKPIADLSMQALASNDHPRY